MNLARALGAIGRTLIVTGVAIFLFVGYQLWGTSVQEAAAQSGLEDDFAELVTQLPAQVTEPGDEAANAPTASTSSSTAPGDAEAAVSRPVDLESLSIDLLTAALAPQQGDVTVRLDLPSIEVSKLVVEGVQVADLRKGPGHYRATPLPGLPGNTGIAGHRTTYGQPFHDIDQLMPGDRIEITSLLGDFVYEVMPPAQAFGDRIAEAQEVGAGYIVVSPNDTWVLDDFDDNRLTLTACHPKLSARQRIVVAARLIGDPVGTPSPEIVEQLQVRTDGTLGPDEGAPGDLGFVDDPTAASAPTAEEWNEVSLDEGLNGDPSALRPAVLFGLIATAIYVLASTGFRRGDRIASVVLGAAPVAAALWFCFEHVDRLLPAY